MAQREKAKSNLISYDIIVGLAFLILVPLAAHLLFSWAGFNPTDDGFTLAYSRRILAGQVPHRDFIIIRPILSPLIHAPFVLLGGDYVYWLSRLFVWFELAFISWVWVAVVNSLTGHPFDRPARFLLGLMAFAASVHNFPIMAWHTIDGLFLCSAGLALCTRQNEPSKLLGYMLIASAYLTKQSFVLVAPVIIITLGDWKRMRYWAAAALPAALYFTYLAATHAIPDAFVQLTSHSDSWTLGVVSFLNWQVLLAAIIGYLGLRLSRGEPKIEWLYRWRSLARTLGVTTQYGLPLLIVAGGLFSGKLYIWSFCLFGLSLGGLAYWILDGFHRGEDSTRTTGFLRAGILVLLAAWSVSISLGYNSPVLGSGLLLALLMSYAHGSVQLAKRRSLVLQFVVALVIVAGFVVSRQQYIYREQSSNNLTERLDNILPGGNLITTNPNTYSFMVDLQQAIGYANTGEAYAIIPDVAGYWVRSPSVNPLPIDWPQNTELSKPALVQRVIDSLEAHRGNIVIIVQKVETGSLAQGLSPLVEDRYPVVQYVRSHFTKANETRFFELYR